MFLSDLDDEQVPGEATGNGTMASETLHLSPKIGATSVLLPCLMFPSKGLEDGVSGFEFRVRSDAFSQDYAGTWNETVYSHIH